MIIVLKGAGHAINFRLNFIFNSGLEKVRKVMLPRTMVPGIIKEGITQTERPIIYRYNRRPILVQEMVLFCTPMIW